MPPERVAPLLVWALEPALQAATVPMAPLPSTAVAGSGGTAGSGRAC